MSSFESLKSKHPPTRSSKLSTWPCVNKKQRRTSNWSEWPRTTRCRSRSSNKRSKLSYTMRESSKRPCKSRTWVDVSEKLSRKRTLKVASQLTRSMNNNLSIISQPKRSLMSQKVLQKCQKLKTRSLRRAESDKVLKWFQRLLMCAAEAVTPTPPIA